MHIRAKEICSCQPALLSTAYSCHLFMAGVSSGDHGPINSWDRQAFFTDVPDVPGFDAAPTLIQSNFIFANYGAAQGVDNDDGEREN